MVFIFEDEGYNNLLPLVYTRPVFELRCGNHTILERIKQFYPGEEIGLIVRDYIGPITKEKYSEHQVPSSKLKFQKTADKALFISGRAILEEKIPIEGEEEILITKKSKTNPAIIGFRIKPPKINRFPIDTKIITKLRLKQKEVSAKLINFPWDLIATNPEQLIKDFSAGQVKGRLDPRAIIYGDLSRLVLEQNARIEPGVILNLHSGPIYVDQDAKICASSTVEGPCYIGKNTIIDGAKIRPKCSFGDNCRIGGEIEASIFQGFSNKHHEGFLGHSYVGEWVNLGALTTNSDLRNDYGSVKVTINKKEIDSSTTKLGCFIGDHTKSAIGTLINTGAMIGIFANIFEPGLSSKTIPSFSWGNKKRWKIEDVLKTTKAVMARRNIVLTKSYENLIRYLYRKLSVGR
jgi:UDP-N-acetylglucosamine diphosphorylase/glucosamine-1-phosphate N-acetyltransferase